MEHKSDQKDMNDEFLPMTSVANNTGDEVAPGVYVLTTKIVNVYFIQCSEEPTTYFLVDAGMPKTGDMITEWAEKWFDGPPKAILLTHGHFDHVGALNELAEKWGVPVYAHHKEIPFLNGEQDYPKPDPSADGGLVTKLSPMFPNHGIDLGNQVQPLPVDASIPGLAGWKWIHTPGHTPGHVSFFRKSDKVLVAGDAFITVEQESLYKVLTQKQELNGPPKYFTTDWEQAKESVQTLAALQPSVAATGHGVPMIGSQLREDLNRLAENFDEWAKPSHGKYVDK
ncbi:MBL fold metallo-hydrolase [Fictibacillus phosphorivorans]|uniref:MBL fold metallo-hydrolase n=1 Tax=Fictibacillus phosphorivorans TaxID=1221500 RepID=UPI002040E9AC|nr:MBL fold metallo-hydrolase [Fictibacillus phosphorivorans]MCM3720240.1 MBL fold metallo-hydrolase [Fictibacillus phosphorivorans]MCM3777915.1 MBL fold metallo-hydrolase [Fictibacillus phosphorivorans]